MSGGAAPARAGYHFELRVRGDLALSYHVGRAGGSKGPWDLIALRAPRELVLVQCKVDGQLPPAEWNELLGLAEEVGGIAVLAHRQEPGHKLQYRRLLQRKGTLRDAPLWEPWQPSRGVEW